MNLIIITIICRASVQIRGGAHKYACMKDVGGAA